MNLQPAGQQVHKVMANRRHGDRLKLPEEPYHNWLSRTEFLLSIFHARGILPLERRRPI